MSDWLRTLNKFLLGIHSLGLVVTAGGIICLKFFDSIVSGYSGFSGIRFPEMWISGTLIFTVYLFDHLRDLRVNKSFIPELAIVKSSKWAMIPVAMVGFLISILLVHKLKESFVILGFISFLLTLIYFLGVKFLPAFITGKLKEFWVALVVSFSIAFIPSYRGANTDIIPVLFFFLICFQNMLLFSWIDYKNDLANRKTTLATQMGLEFVAWFFDILMLIHIAFLADIAYSEGLNKVILILFLMQLVLLAVRIFLEKKGSRPILRFWTDSIFLVPLFFV